LLTRRMKIWKSPKTSEGKGGSFLEDQWCDFFDFTQQQKLIQKARTPRSDLHKRADPEINKFDRDKVRVEAKAFDMSKL